jgi:choline dehydrogenase-like flavoprotein
VSDAYDAVVVGSGATGGCVAKELTEAGLSVLVVEAGPTFAPADLTRTEGGDVNWAERRTTQAKKSAVNKSTYHLYVDDVDNPYSTPTERPFHWIRGRQLGGRTLMWGRVALRFSDYDFKAASRDGHGQDWPLSYADLEPYYDRIEEFVGVTGTCERLSQIPDGKFLPAAPMTRGEQLFKAAVESRWPNRRVMMNRGIPVRVRRELGTDWPTYCSTGSTLAAAANTGRLTVKDNAIVRSVLVDDTTDRAVGVSIVDASTGLDYDIRARVVVLCASTIESLRILLHSTSARHPHGLGNSSGLLGKGLMDKLRLVIMGVVPALEHEGLTLSPLGGEHSIIVPRFCNITEHQSGFLRGYHIFGAVGRDVGLPRARDSEIPFAFSINGEHLSRDSNHVSLNRDQVDKWGIPTVHIDCAYSDNEAKLAASALASMREMLREANFEITNVIDTPVAPGWMVHEVGGARMGTDPATSVVNPFNQTWDCRNLYVADGACWVSAGCQNPTLTMMAIAARASHHIANKFRSGDV